MLRDRGQIERRRRRRRNHTVGMKTERWIRLRL